MTHNHLTNFYSQTHTYLKLMQWAVLTEAFFDQWMNGYPNWHYIDVTIYVLLDALYAVSAVLITFGGIIGKVSPFQLLIVTIIELALHR